MFKTVSRHSFSAIQTGLFPIYFGIQTAVPVILALTFPSNALFGIPSGISGVLHETGRWTALAPLATAFITGLVNLVILLPLVTTVMKERRGQGTVDLPTCSLSCTPSQLQSLTPSIVKRDGKEWFAEGPHSEEMRALNKKFGILHGVSSLLNLATLVATVAYGFTLGARIQFGV